MKKLVFLFLLLFPPYIYSAERFYNLVVGQSKVISSLGVKSVAVGDSTVVDVKVLPGGNEIMLTGLNPGTTNVILMHQDGRKTEFTIRVLASDPEAIADAIRRALEGVEGVSVRVAGSNVILEGEILKKSDQELVDEVLKNFPGVISLIKKKRLLPELMVQLDVKMVEISGTSSLDFGFEWPPVIAGHGTISLSFQDTTDSSMTKTFQANVLSNLSAGLKLLSSTGRLRILSNPILITRNGEKAKFLAGGEIPIPSAGALGQVDVEYKEFGVLLEFTPEADAYGNVALELKVSVSDIDYSNAVAVGGFSIPALRKREASAKVNLSENQSLALAEILTENERKNVTKYPFLGHIPILGELFKSRSFQKGKSHFLVFITPIIVKPGELPQERIKSMLKKYEEWKSEVRGGILD